MSQVGRNDPCPCGSGRKFKRCCLNKAQTGKLYLPGERDSALAKLMRFSERREFEHQHKMALALFWGEWLSEEPDEDLEEVMDSEQVNLAYHSWFAFDFDLGESRTLFDLFLEREVNNLSTGERKFVENMRGSHLRLYEVLEVKPDQGFELRDLWDDRLLYVAERAATRQIVAWDLIVARIVPGADGEMIFETLPYLFRAAAKDELLKGLRKAHHAFTRQFPKKSLIDFFKSMAPLFHTLWLEEVALRPVPKLITGDGEPFIFAKVIFDLVDRDTAIRSLADRDDIVDQDDGSYVWLEAAGAFQRSLGTIVLEDRRVVFETTSQKRAEKAREGLPTLLGDSVRFRAIRYEDVGQALKRGPAPAKKKKIPEIPADVQAEVLGRFYDEHYHKWLDEPVPALGDRTPRHAAKLKTVRPKLITLLKDFESHSERQRRSGEIAYDFSWMWKELGLRRE
jgi:hypothetical protein